MVASKLNRYWTLSAILLIAIVATGGIVVWSRFSPSQPIEISIPPTQDLKGRIYIGGAITNPGFYSLITGDGIDALIQAAGDTTSNANLDELKLYIPRLDEEQGPQKIDINRAEAWLLQALPGIGQTKAQAIVDYREQNGLFHNAFEITKVTGIGTTTYEQIKHLITVAD